MIAIGFSCFALAFRRYELKIIFDIFSGITEANYKYIVKEQLLWAGDTLRVIITDSNTMTLLNGVSCSSFALGRDTSTSTSLSDVPSAPQLSSRQVDVAIVK